MVTPNKTLNLIPPKAPNLPIGPVEYTQSYQDQFLNALRLYFNQIDNFGAGLVNGLYGGALLNFPYGAFHQDGVTNLTANISNNSTTPIPVTSTAAFPSGGGYILIGTEIIQYTATTPTSFAGTITRGALSTTQAAHNSGAQVAEVQGTGSGTAYGVVKLNNTDYSNGVSINPNDLTQIVFNQSGYYNIQFSAQLLSFANAVDNVTIWVRQNGVDVPSTAGIITVPAIHGGVPGAIIGSWNYILPFNQNDVLQFYWTTDSGNSVISTYPPGLTPVHPSSPAMIVTAQFVSALV